MSKPIVAVVGRPNVGKSTLFNRLAGERISIVQDTPGVTRDRIYADCEWLDRKFTLIDTGGMEIGSEEIIQRQIIQQAQIAIETADVILFVTDVKTGVTEDDLKVANMLRRTKKPVVPLMATTSAISNALKAGADDGRKATPLTVWKNRQNKKL